jgi:hypothetical protein
VKEERKERRRRVKSVRKERERSVKEERKERGRRRRVKRESEGRVKEERKERRRRVKSDRKERERSAKEERKERERRVKRKRRESPAGLRLRWENKQNIWFWHHWPPELPLGHNCSNPSPRLSAECIAGLGGSVWRWNTSDIIHILVY